LHYEDGTCPGCNYGRIRTTRQPYVRVFRGHLFTVPDAICFVCDVCEYCEFEDTIVDIMGEMIFVAQSGVDDPNEEPKKPASASAPLLPEEGDSASPSQRLNP